MPKPETRGTDSGKLTVRSSVKPLDPANDNLIDRTIALWRSRLGRDLSREDAREIAENVVGFFRILHEWSATGNGPPAKSANAAVPSTEGYLLRSRSHQSLAGEPVSALRVRHVDGADLSA
ncbi:MAG: hypothetical protein WAV78_11905, partial [Xanthobacteraceae bacterium]